MIIIDRIDHIVLTVRDLAVTINFYSRVLGMTPVEFEGRKALAFGRQKLNLHLAGHEFEPKAHLAAPGTADICLITTTPIEAVVAHLGRENVAILQGPVMRTGAIGPIRSVYFRDPDQNLVEVSNYVEP